MSGEYLYRFRPIDFRYEKDGELVKKALAEELKNREIVFGTISENNDPMDGAQSTYWEGDDILWKNFVNHFALCLFDAALYLPLFGNKHIFEVSDVRVWLTPDDLPTEESKNLFQRYLTAIQQNPNIQALISILIGLKKLDSFTIENILGMFLTDFLQEVNSLNKSFNGEDLFPNYTKLHEIKDKSKWSELFLNPEITDKLSVLSEISRGVSDEIRLAVAYNNFDPDDEFKIIKQNHVGITTRFHSLYIKACSDSIFPPYYTASFSRSYSDIAMWGNYASGHQGICLIFKPEEDDNNQFLELENGERTRFYEVTYADQIIKQNYFTSLAFIPRFKLEKYWMKDESGYSDYYKIYNDEYAKNYWETFTQKTQSKFESWKKEEEVRAIRQNPYRNNLKFDERMLKYKFESLYGIIFGMNTPEHSKYEIISVIEKELRARGEHLNFKFYQAELDSENFQIRKREIKLKFKENESST